MRGCTVTLIPVMRQPARWRSKNLEIIEREDLVARSKARGERLLEGLQSLLEFPMVGEARGLGLLCAIEIVKDKDSREPDAALAGRIAKMCMERGLRTRPVGSALAFSPPLVINDDEVDEIIKRLGSVLDSI